jgi:hypothetical protein
MSERVNCTGSRANGSLKCLSEFDGSYKTDRAYDSKCMKKSVRLNKAEKVQVYQEVEINPITCKDRPTNLNDLKCPHCKRMVIKYASFKYSTKSIAYIPITKEKES